jgi:ribosomal protein S18 acetylase RimI-like enzyme
MFRKAKLSDLDKLVRIHYSELNSDFLPSLGINFLRLLYSDLLALSGVYVVVYEDGGYVKGFIVGSKNFERDFNEIIKKGFIKYFLSILPQILKRPLMLKNLVETLFYPKKEGLELPVSELVVIAVSGKSHRKGIGRKLVLELEKKLSKENVKKYKVSANKNNYVANQFYKSLGFKKHSDFFLYGKIVNLYLKKI